MDKIEENIEPKELPSIEDKSDEEERHFSDDKNNAEAKDAAKFESKTTLYIGYIDRLYKYQTLIMALSAATTAYSIEKLETKSFSLSSSFLIVSVICCATSVLQGLFWIKNTNDELRNLYRSEFETNKMETLGLEDIMIASRLKAAGASKSQYLLFLTGVVLLGLYVVVDMWHRTDAFDFFR